MTGQMLTDSLNENIQQIQLQLGNSSDLRIRKIPLGNSLTQVAVIYMEGLVSKNSVQQLLDSFVKFMDDKMDDCRFADEEITDVTGLVCKFAITIGDIKSISDLSSLILDILSGNTFIGIDGCTQGIIVETADFEHRTVSEPTSQTVIRGPQEGFTETIGINISLIRRKIKDPNLWLETRRIGRVTQTTVAVMHLKGTADPKIVIEVQERLKQIDIDGILESNYIEELIKDNAATLFPTVYNTERPDVVAAALLEGRVAILVDGTPFVLLVPALFTQFFQAAEDYYHSQDFGFLRSLRFLGLFISLLAPAMYIAITTFHQEMLPTLLLISLASQREGIPFPAFVEALIMEVIFELLREASIRMPKAIGSAISIVGALVLGQAAVEAGLVSPGMVIVVSITAIAGFIFPTIEMSITTRLLRFLFMVLAASFGLFGIVVLLIYIVLHLCHLQSFGVPYMTPFAPFNLADQKDNLLRVSWRQMIVRPYSFSPFNRHRQPAAHKQTKQASNSGDRDAEAKGK